MKEHNLREKAKKHAEYITGKSLRKYVAEKVKKYVGDNPTVFDGACGSGQMEEFVNPRFIQGVEIQKEACEAFLENFPTSKVFNGSFFNYKDNAVCDCVVMNPPFSIKFNDLSEEEKLNIQSEFPWKKSGNVDDIFILKSLNFTKRYAFHLFFLGLSYRKAEKIFRELCGDMVVEFNVVNNGFEDTSISVGFLVLDKEKVSDEVHKELYDCRSDKVVAEESVSRKDKVWEVIREERHVETIEDIESFTVGLRALSLGNFKRGVEMELLNYEMFGADYGLEEFFKAAVDIATEALIAFRVIKGRKCDER